jgi:hypothetical protein
LEIIRFLKATPHCRGIRVLFLESLIASDRSDPSAQRPSTGHGRLSEACHRATLELLGPALRDAR